ncbi:MAG: sn-glycerol-3-phosphate ABC transporter ATP-binding protein UgpC, partial [Acidimicrobiia bacterium]|nr:sn-glycerol-3-phosphate ABC transporter ATP-binding protein UgpC [Acidimicrobiia bacterium]
MGAIRIEGLGRRYGSVDAVREVTLDIEDGEFLVLLGPSGCGKSTVLRMLAGLLEPTTGRILLDGRDITHERPKARDVAMVFQSYALYPHMTVARNIGFALRLRGAPKADIAARVAEVAELLQLDDLLGRRPRELSGGQRQRVALGRAIAREPAAFLMDEPLSNLDAKLRTATRAELSALHRRLGTTFVYVTHDQVEAMTMATHVAVMSEGRLEQVGTPAEVYDTPATTFVAGFVGSPPMNLLPGELASRGGCARFVAPGAEATLWAEGDPGRRAATLGIRPEHLRPATPGAPGPLLVADVVAIENLGSDEVALCRVGGVPLAVRGPRPLGLAPDERVELTAAPAHAHVFDTATGRRLIWQAQPAGEADHGAEAEREHAAGRVAV